MTKWLVIWLATVAVSGAALLGTGMYAATNSTNFQNQGQWSNVGRGIGWPENMVNSLSGKVSSEALTALQTLMTKHQTTMDAARTAGTKPTETEMKTQIDTFKTEMDALMTKYPELKTAMPTAPMGKKMGRGVGQGQNRIDTILSWVSDADKAAIEAIRSEHRSRQEALRTEEKAKIDAIIAKYPELKAKIDTMEANRPQMDGKNPQWKSRGTNSAKSSRNN